MLLQSLCVGNDGCGDCMVLIMVVVMVVIMLMSDVNSQTIFYHHKVLD